MPPKAGRAAPKPEPNQTDRKAPPSLPSVWDLGIIAERFRIMANNIDATPANERSVASPHRLELDKQSALLTARDREHATVDLLLTLPAQSLHDAAVQIHHCAFLLDQAETDDPAQSALAIRMLRTAIASVGAAVVDHSGLDFIGSGIDFTDTLDQWTNLHLEASKPSV